MEINHYRLPDSQGLKEAWDSCQFTSETDLSDFNVKSLVTINGQPILRQHHSAYLTGKDTSRAHHFAKYLAIQLLTTPHPVSSGTATAAPSAPGPVGGGSAAVTPSTPNPSSSGTAAVTPSAPCLVGRGSAAVTPTPCKVLWIDTLHGPHVCASIYRELASHATVKSDLHFVCLDILGGQRDNVYALNMNIEALISRFKPALVVIDDIDHFMPYCGVKQATDFCRIVRDVTNHTETAFLFIGYNHLGKKASTTGNLGKHLFIDATDVFSLNTQRDITTVCLVRSYDLSRNADDTEFRFTIGPDNLPKEAAPLPKSRTPIIDDATLTGIITDVLQPGQTVTPDELMRQVTTRHRELRQQDRTTQLLNQALRLNLLHPHGNSYILPPLSTPCPVNGATPCPVGGGSAAVSPSTPNPSSSGTAAVASVTPCPVGGGSAAVNPAVESLDPSASPGDFNNPLTLPPHPATTVECPVNGASADATSTKN